MFSAIATILVYTGFAYITHFSFWFIKFPHKPKLGITLLLISNVMWVIHFAITKDFTALLWQSGFIIININWLKNEYKGEL
jgi:hypothetical protein